ncbi:5-amino-6-(5-phospho-D-ribitylamino)uracil phosphatase YcsE [Shouchella clausii]|uniref:Cof-type HAD-IIB family hydrolase n=1 Tax=Shouchella clausii TaxID=79880 RepID=UPI001B131D83|nr:Cof-type HAD-IIB family hydrolase [Shouchella clausii]MCM3311297.1 Cof-type HAD-IIB family hydrolase [Psychrobacillus sp. MER TA 17]GIN07716.1 5-amino-6-(5-phospho-D-ribitylamino)uracil phosphatase YcsE [Shouchella clausii]
MDQQIGPHIQLIALDMDGTLLDDNHEISEGNREAIAGAQELGVHVVLATGRTLASCGKYATSLGLKSFLVTANGSEIYDCEGSVFNTSLMPPEAVDHIYELTEKHGVHVWGASRKSIFRGKLPDDRHGHEWLKFGFDTEDDEVRKAIIAELQLRAITEITNSSPTNIEINALGINKAFALKKVCDDLGISLQNVMAVGDSLNDIAMITEAGLGIAMGNAQEAVKRKADWITATNTNDGVAAAIQRWVVLPQQKEKRKAEEKSSSH